MFSNYLKAIEGVHVYPIISMLIFVVFFIVLLVWMWKADKKHLARMSNLPLDPEEKTNNNFSGDVNGN